MNSATSFGINLELGEIVHFWYVVRFLLLPSTVMDAKQEAQMWTAALAKAIRSEQGALDLSDADVANAAGIPTTTYWSLSKGRTAVKTAQLRKIAHALGMTPGQLFDLADARMAKMQAPGAPEPKTDAEKTRDYYLRRFPPKDLELKRDESDAGDDSVSDDQAEQA